MSGPYKAAGCGRNYGYGRDLAYAGRQALIERYGGGHFSTVATHASRFAQFVSWAKDNENVRDLARNNPQQLLERYAAHVKCLEPEAAYGQNLISSTQITMRALTGDHSIRVSPSEICGNRTNIRSDTPGSLDRGSVHQAVRSMQQHELMRAAAVVELSREFGVREREAALADLDRWYREADRRGHVNVQDGTKGGRTAERWVQVSAQGKEALNQAITARPQGSRNLLAPGESFRKFVHSVLKSGRQHLKAAGIPNYHDCRAAYACERYQRLTRFSAPVIAGRREAPWDVDQGARIQISYELGHGRVDVLVSYVGGKR